MKRPAAMIKQEKPTPKKKAREQEPAEAELGTEPGEAEPGEAEPGEADSQQVADQEPAKAAPASGSKPEKALPAMATEKAKAKAKALPAPSKAQWNDVHYTMKKLEKAGKMDFPEKWKKACVGQHESLKLTRLPFPWMPWRAFHLSHRTWQNEKVCYMTVMSFGQEVTCLPCANLHSLLGRSPNQA